GRVARALPLRAGAGAGGLVGDLRLQLRQGRAHGGGGDGCARARAAVGRGHVRPVQPARAGGGDDARVPLRRSRLRPRDDLVRRLARRALRARDPGGRAGRPERRRPARVGGGPGPGERGDDRARRGGGPSFGTAFFGRAKLIESAHLPGGAHELEEWAHEEYFCTGPGRTTIVVAPPGASHDRAVEQLRAAREIGATAAVVSAPGSAAAEAAELVLPVA